MCDLSRRSFLAQSASCAAHLTLAASAMPAIARAAWARPNGSAVVAREPFGNLERVADGVWALISNPLGGDRTTLCNGGLIAGRDGVLAIEGFNQPAGAQWLAGKAKELTGRYPTHVVLTHFHADHANGIAGYMTDGAAPRIHATARTRDLVLEKNQPADAARSSTVQGALSLDASSATTLDLGGRVVRIVPHDGHTPSDVALVLDEPNVVFCGDLVWNAMFPNFVDATPSHLKASVRALRRNANTVYVPGHGPIAHQAEFDRYVAMLDEVERAARDAKAKGMTTADAAKGFTLPESLGAWTMFSPSFYERAFAAWYREGGGTDGAGLMGRD